MLLALTPDSAPAAPAAARSRTTPEHALIEAIRSGDERLAAQVHASLLPSVHATLGRVLGWPCPGHEQLTQLGIERTIAEISRHPTPWVCKLETWATAMSARVALEMLRGRARTSGVEGSWGEAAHAPEDEPCAATASAAVQRLRWLLAELPAREAEAIVLCDVMGLTPTEAAVMLGDGVERVRRLLSTGHARLARALS